MATYKISGIVAEEAVIYIIQDEEYKGKRRVPAGRYEMIFESESSSGVVAVAENVEGKIMSFGKVTPMDATGQTPNLSASRGITAPKDATKLSISYDKNFDILYISIGAPKEGIATELEEGDLLRFELSSNELVGITLMDFASRFMS
jgi:hypothetical protein